jgi:acetyl-CoA carboxylase carboxyl transferase subunit beta
MDPLEFQDMKPYPDRVRESQAKTGLQDAIRTGTGTLHGIPVALAVMEFGFMGGSMGSVVGEKLTRLIEYATQEGLTLLVVCTSGGARMQEGIMSLMQMAKISGALHVHQNEANLLYISILTSPTTGGVTASFGMLGDIIMAEPQAIIGFAGRRVIEQTLREELPDDFQVGVGGWVGGWRGRCQGDEGEEWGKSSIRGCMGWVGVVGVTGVCEVLC